MYYILIHKYVMQTKALFLASFSETTDLLYKRYCLGLIEITIIKNLSHIHIIISYSLSYQYNFILFSYFSSSVETNFFQHSLGIILRYNIYL